jgi:hypothetical protein
MRRRPVDSSALRSVGYDAGSRILEIEFSSGAVYRYRNVPPKVYFELLAAESCGTYFATHVRPVFTDYFQVS